MQRRTMEINDNKAPPTIPDPAPSPGGRYSDGRGSDDDVKMTGQGDVSESILDSYDEDDAHCPPLRAEVASNPDPPKSTRKDLSFPMFL